jgi:hypothetical protein
MVFAPVCLPLRSELIAKNVSALCNNDLPQLSLNKYSDGSASSVRPESFTNCLEEFEMGYSHIVTVVGDAFAVHKPADLNQAINELGKQVHNVCFAPQYAQHPEGPERMTWGQIGNGQNAVQWVDEVHSTEARTYLWTGNCLRPLGALDDEELDFVLRYVEDEREKRQSRRNASA